MGPLLSFIGLTLFILFLRFLYITPAINPSPPYRRKRGDRCWLMVVLGSGGHTAEMLALLRTLDTSTYAHRTYIISEGDAFSADKAREFESAIVSKNEQDADATSYNIITVPRARKIHQPLYTTPFSALRCLLQCVGALDLRQSIAIQNVPDKAIPGLSRYPDLILVNGPGTAVCLVFAWLLVHFFDVSYNSYKPKTRTIYVESWARVRTLSLSGKILLPFVDRFLVQWKALEGVGGRAEYIGVLV